MAGQGQDIASGQAWTCEDHEPQHPASAEPVCAVPSRATAAAEREPHLNQPSSSAITPHTTHHTETHNTHIGAHTSTAIRAHPTLSSEFPTHMFDQSLSLSQFSICKRMDGRGANHRLGMASPNGRGGATKKQSSFSFFTFQGRRNLLSHHHPLILSLSRSKLPRLSFENPFWPTPKLLTQTTWCTDGLAWIGLDFGQNCTGFGDTTHTLFAYFPFFFLRFRPFFFLYHHSSRVVGDTSSQGRNRHGHIFRERARREEGSFDTTAAAAVAARAWGELGEPEEGNGGEALRMMGRPASSSRNQKLIGQLFDAS